MTRRRPAIGDPCGCRQRDLGERCAARRPYLHADDVAGDEIRLGDDRRNAVRPAQVLGAGADGEVLAVALADELPERRLVAAVDVDIERGRATGVAEQPAVEGEGELPAAMCGKGARRTGREHDERGEHEVSEAPSHFVDLLASTKERKTPRSSPHSV